MTETKKPGVYFRRPTHYEAIQWDGSYETAKAIHEWLDVNIEATISINPLDATLKVHGPVVETALIGDYVMRTSSGNPKIVKEQDFIDQFLASDSLEGLLSARQKAETSEPDVDGLDMRDLFRAERERGASPLVVVAPRGQGKTTLLLEEMLDDPNAVYVTHSNAAAFYAFEQYMEMRKSQPLADAASYHSERERFFAWSERNSHPRGSRRDVHYLIDNADLILQVNGTTPSVVTMSDTSE